MLLLDDQPSRSEGGIEVRDAGFECRHLDYVVVRVGERERVDFGQGDRVVLEHRGCGRRVKLDGVVYRLVRTNDIIAVIEGGKEVRDMATKTTKKAPAKKTATAAKAARKGGKCGGKKCK